MIVLFHEVGRLRCITGFSHIHLGNQRNARLYDNMKTAVDRVGRGKERQINMRCRR